MAEIIRPTWKGIREFVSAAIDAAYNDYDSEGRFPRLIIPYAVNKYITNVVVDTFFEPSPEDIGEKLQEPHAPVLGTIAEEMVYYLPVLSRIPEHLRRQSA
jgi:hypothetical protein